jgi:hypothetical protein
LVNVIPPSGGGTLPPAAVAIDGVDISTRIQVIDIKWPATTDQPTCTVTCNNQDGYFTTAPLTGNIAITLPGGVGPFNFALEEVELDNTLMQGGGLNTGHVAVLTGTAGPELLFLSEGNLDVVGTDLTAGIWNNRQSTYAPYPSVYVAGVNTNLLDVGTIINVLLHVPQPNQTAGYRGRLGYDIGLGVKTSGIDYAGGLLGYYVKGMWQVGLGSTGAQKTGLDILRDVCTKNIIDGNGVPNVLDFFVDNRVTPPLVKAFARGSTPVSATITVGQKDVQDVKLPVDTTDLKNFIVYWANAEAVYPAGGDAWSNYDSASNGTYSGFAGLAGSNAHILSAWSPGNVFGTGTITADVTLANTATATGTSIMFANNGGGSTDFSVYLTFDLGLNNYAPILCSGRGLSSFNFYFNRAYTMNSDDSVSVVLYDIFGNSASHSVSIPASNPAANAQGSYLVPVSVAIPSSGSGTWAPTGTWDFASTIISQVQLVVQVGGAAGLNNTFWFDDVNFTTNWDFSPVYSYNPLGPDATWSAVAASQGSYALNPKTVAPFQAGQWVTLNPFAAAINQYTAPEVYQIASVVNGPANTPQINLSTPLLSAHSAPVQTTLTGSANLATATNIAVTDSTGFYPGQFVYIGHGTDFEVNTVMDAGGGSGSYFVDLLNPLLSNHASGEPIIGVDLILAATHDVDSVGAYGLRVDNFVDFYTTQGASDAAVSVAQSILTSRQGKKSQGTVKLDGRAPQVKAITPGSRIILNDAPDVYVGGNLDSTINSWIVDAIEYSYDTLSTGGFQAIYTVEPFYTFFVPGSPDTNSRNLWMARSFGQYVARLIRSTEHLGYQK